MSRTNYLISLQQMSKTFVEGDQSQQVLKNINLNIEQNEFVAITGTSGSGKSTLLSILGLLEQHDSGDYLLCGQSVSNFSRYQLSQLRNKSIGWIFQNFNLVQDMTVLENVLLPLRYRTDFDTAKGKISAQQALESVGLAEKKDDYPAKLSGGQQQRVAIARAIVTEPDLLLADEPTGNLDSHNSASIFTLLQQLHRNGRTIIMVTHDDAQARLCPCQVTLCDGEVVSVRREPLANENVV